MTAPAIKRVPTFGPHLKIQVSGQLGPPGGAWEIFSYGLSIAGSGVLNVTPGHLQDLIDDVLAFHSSGLTALSASARVTEVKVAEVLPDGKWRNAQPLARRIVDVAGGRADEVGRLRHAPQVALAVTLRTATPGPRGRGRFYLPLPTWNVLPADGLIDSGSAATTAQMVVELINKLNDQPGVDATDDRVVVASTFGGVHPVTSVQVGRVLDTIRNRRSRLRELYVTGPAITNA